VPGQKGWLMDFERVFRKTPASLDDIRIRVTHALQRHPLCRTVQFDVVRTPRSPRGSNWTVSLRSVEPRALWEASDIVADIQDAYDLAAMA
jgi:hypothetical protein